MTNSLLNTKQNLQQNLVPWRAYFIGLHEKKLVMFITFVGVNHVHYLQTPKRAQHLNPF